MYYNNTTNLIYRSTQNCKDCSHYSVCKWTESMSKMKDKVDEVKGLQQVSSPITAIVTCRMFNANTYGVTISSRSGNDLLKTTSHLNNL